MTPGHLLLVGAAAAVAIVAGVAAARPASLLDLFVSRKGYSVEASIPYGEGPRRSLDLYVPDRPDPDAPLIVFLYGGSWQSGSKANYRFVGQTFASRGIFVAIPDYRLHPEVTFPGFVEDAAAAVAAIARRATKADGSPRRLFVMGHSAGAHIGALVALDPRYLAAAGGLPRPIDGFIGLAGPYDFLPLRSRRFQAVFPEATRAESQPIAHVTGKAPPMLLLTGDEDRTVDPRNSQRLAAKAKGAGVPAEVIVYPGVAHLGVMTALAEALPGRKPPVRADILRFIGRPR